jgi:hypothetical protein
VKRKEVEETHVRASSLSVKWGGSKMEEGWGAGIQPQKKVGVEREMRGCSSGGQRVPL